MKTKSLRTRLMVILLIVGIVPVLTTVTYNFFSNSKTFDEVQIEQQSVLDVAFAEQIADEVKEATLLAQNITQQPNIDLKNKSYWQSVEKMLEGQIHSLQVVADNSVVYQGANSVNMATHWEKALAGTSWSGFEHIKGTLYLSVYMPINQNGQTVGAIHIHLEDEYMQSLQEMFPEAVISVADSSGVVKISSDESNYSKQLEGLSETEIVHRKDEKAQTLTSFIPLQQYIPTSKEFLIVEVSIVTMMATLDSLIDMGGFILLSTIIIAVIVAVFYSRTLTIPLIRTSKLMNVLSSGDLTKRIENHNRQDEIGKLMTDMKQMQEALHETISEVKVASDVVTNKSTVLAQSTQQVSTGAQSINETMESLSQGIESQTTDISQVREFVTDFTVSLQQTTEQGRELQSLSNNIRQLSTNGTERLTHSSAQITQTHTIMEQSIEKMNELGENVVQINSFVSIIEDVANQTNLLALNASIEAARAGEHGKGFAVVADEVRKLAEQVASSVTQITTIVSTIQSSSKDVSVSLQQGFSTMDEGTQQLASTVELFDEIEQSVNEMATSIQFVISQLDEVSSEGQHIEQSMQNIAAVTQETAASVEETTAMVLQTNMTITDVANASEELSHLADHLNKVVSKYKI